MLVMFERRLTLIVVFATIALSGCATPTTNTPGAEPSSVAGDNPIDLPPGVGSFFVFFEVNDGKGAGAGVTIEAHAADGYLVAALFNFEGEEWQWATSSGGPLRDKTERQLTADSSRALGLVAWSTGKSPPTLQIEGIGDGKISQLITGTAEVSGWRSTSSLGDTRSDVVSWGVNVTRGSIEPENFVWHGDLSIQSRHKGSADRSLSLVSWQFSSSGFASAGAIDETIALFGPPLARSHETTPIQSANAVWFKTGTGPASVDLTFTGDSAFPRFALRHATVPIDEVLLGGRIREYPG